MNRIFCDVCDEQIEESANYALTLEIENPMVFDKPVAEPLLALRCRVIVSPAFSKVEGRVESEVDLCKACRNKIVNEALRDVYEQGPNFIVMEASNEMPLATDEWRKE